MAAGVQSGIGNVAAGSAFAILQKFGMIGLFKGMSIVGGASTIASVSGKITDLTLEGGKFIGDVTVKSGKHLADWSVKGGKEVGKWTLERSKVVGNLGMLYGSKVKDYLSEFI